MAKKEINFPADINVRISEEDRDFLTKKSKLLRMNLGAYCRMLILRGSGIVKEEFD